MSEQRDFTALVWEAAGRCGRKAPEIADDLLKSRFPETLAAAEREDASVFVRRGLVEQVGRVLKAANDDEAQADFADIDPAFRTIARQLKSKSYYVEHLAEHVPVARLIASPALLDDARKYMHRKGQECFDEAQRLDALYAAVMRGAA